MELEIQHSLEVCIANLGYAGTVRVMGGIGFIIGILFWELSRFCAKLLCCAFFKGYKSEKNREE